MNTPSDSKLRHALRAKELKNAVKAGKRANHKLIEEHRRSCKTMARSKL